MVFDGIWTVWGIKGGWGVIFDGVHSVEGDWSADSGVF